MSISGRSLVTSLFPPPSFSCLVFSPFAAAAAAAGGGFSCSRRGPEGGRRRRVPHGGGGEGAGGRRGRRGGEAAARVGRRAQLEVLGPVGVPLVSEPRLVGAPFLLSAAHQSRLVRAVVLGGFGAPHFSIPSGIGWGGLASS